jgi:hypothetical protein
MAGYSLYLDAPEGAAALLRKKERVKDPDDAIGVWDDDVYALGVQADPYVGRVWSGPSLVELRAELEAKLSKWRQDVHAKVLVETHRPRIEPWMQALVARYAAEDKRIGLAERLLELVCRAEGARGVIVYFED